MGETKQIPSAEWAAYFDRLSRRFLADREPETATLEVFSPSLGDQIEAQTARLLGMTYDARRNTLEISLMDLDHLAFEPHEIWVIEEDDGFVSAIEIKLGDDRTEILHLHRSGPPALRYEQPPGTTS